MTYVIKDKERLRKLTELWPKFPEFLKDEQQCELYDGELNVDAGDGSTIHFNPDEFEIQKDYNPKAWNNFPEITPPEGVWMRCECRAKSFCTCHTGLIFRNNRWEYETGEAARLYGDVLRFRPWDD